MFNFMSDAVLGALDMLSLLVTITPKERSYQLTDQETEA